jgi:uridine phosphorylase
LLAKAAGFRADFGGRRQGITHLEMETAGLYGLSRLMGHRAVSVSALLAHRLHQRFCQEPKKVMQACIQQVLQILEDHPEPVS